MSRKLPWSNSKKWQHGFWYPLTLGHDIEFLSDERTIECASWDLFRLDPAYDEGHPLFGDITGMGLSLDFITAVKIANNVNPEQLWSASWINEAWTRKPEPMGPLKEMRLPSTKLLRSSPSVSTTD